MARRVVAGLFGFGIAKVKQLDIKIADGLDVFHLERDVGDAADLLPTRVCFVAADLNQLGNRAAWCAKLDGNHAGIAHHHAAIGLNVRCGFLQVFHLNAEVVNAGASACSG